MYSRGNFLLHNFLAIILTVIGLVFFALGMYKLYEASVDQESESAKHLLTSIVSKIEALPTQSQNEFTFQGVNSEEGWQLVGWNASDRTKPARCGLGTSKGCLCICRERGSSSDCQSQGFCQLLTQPSASTSSSPAPYRVGVVTNAPAAVGSSGVIHRGCIVLPSNLFEITITKSSSEIILFRDMGSVSYTQSDDDFNRLEKCTIRLSQDQSSPL